MRSIRARVLAGVFASLVLLLLLNGLAIYLVIRRAFYREFDSSLLAISRAMVGAVEVDHGMLDVEISKNQVPELENASQPVYFRLWRPGGAPLVAGRRDLDAALPRLEGADGAPVWQDLRMGDLPLRAVGLRFTPVVDRDGDDDDDDWADDDDHEARERHEHGEAGERGEAAEHGESGESGEAAAMRREFDLLAPLELPAGDDAVTGAAREAAGAAREAAGAVGDGAAERANVGEDDDDDEDVEEKAYLDGAVYDADGAIRTAAFETSIPFEPGSPVVLVVARSSAELEHRLQTLLWVLIGTGTATLAVVGGLAYALITRGLRPLTGLARRIGAINEGSLRLDPDPTPMPSELQPVADRLTDLMQRLERAFRREREFSGDVAHELRTPLSGLLTTLEVTLGRERSTAEYVETLNETLAMTRQMRTMVEQLLMLGRLDAGTHPFAPEALDLAPLLRDALADVAAQLEAKGVAVTVDLPPTLPAWAEAACFAMVARNVLANAAEYVDEGGQLELRASASSAGSGVTVRIANTGCLLQPADAHAVFERFWRGDASRTDTGEHHGLGMSIVARLMRLLQGEAHCEITEAGRFIITLHLPRQAAAVATTTSMDAKPTPQEKG